MRAELGQPVVVHPQARLLQFHVFHVEQDDTEARIQDFGNDAIEVLILEALRGIPATRPRRLIAVLHVLAQCIAAAPRSEHTGDGERMKAGADEEVGSAAGLLVLDDARRVIAIFTVQPLDPQVARLRHMRIRRNHLLHCHRRVSSAMGLAGC